MKKSVLILGIVLVAVGGGGYYYYTSQQKAEAAEQAAGEMNGAPQAAPVSVLELKNQTITMKHSLPGRITPYRQAEIRPQVDGIITERLFKEGSDVKKGDQLYQIDDARYKAQLNSALADLTSSKANIKTTEARTARYRDLVKIKAVSQQEYEDAVAALDQAKAGIEVAEAAVEIAQVNLDYTKVYAPIDGRIGKSLVTEGALVTANQGQSMAVITQLDPVFIDMQQSGSEAMQLRSRMMGRNVIPVELVLGEQADAALYPHKASLQFSEVTVDETTGSIALRAEVINPDGVLLPGLFVRANLNLGQEEALLVPQRATTRSPDGSLNVWIVDAEEKAQPRPIKASRAFEGSWIVEDGLQAGDRVIVEGYQKVGPDMPVKPMPWKAEGAELPAPHEVDPEQDVNPVQPLMPEQTQPLQDTENTQE
jgi:membrane fusion protein, multidrug efflux system